jgi:hypothetical protein
LKRRIQSFLQENRIYIKPNFTKSSLEEIVRVAVIPFLNSDITFRQGFSNELNNKLQEVVNWKDDDFKHKHPCINNDFKFDVVVSKSTEWMIFQKENISTLSTPGAVRLWFQVRNLSLLLLIRLDHRLQ